MRVWPWAVLSVIAISTAPRAENPGEPDEGFDLPLPALPLDELPPPPPAEEPPTQEEPPPAPVVAPAPAPEEEPPPAIVAEQEPPAAPASVELEVIAATPGDVPSPGLMSEPVERDHPPAWWDSSHRRVSSAASGISGLRRLHSALPGPEGTVRLGLGGEWFTGRDVIADGDRNTRFAGGLALTFVPPGPAKFLEVFAVYRNVSNANTLGTPPLILTLGDVSLGVKAGMPLPVPGLQEALSAGIDVGVSPMVGAGELVFASVPVRSNLLVSFDARKLWPRVPVVAHLNGGWASPTRVTPSAGLIAGCTENFAAGATEKHRLGGGLGVEVPLPYVTPFVEWQATNTLLDSTWREPAELDPCLAPLNAGSGFQSTLGLGARITAVPGMTFDLGGEVRLTDLPRRTALPEAPWQLFASVTYTLEPWKAPEVREVVKEVEVIKVVEREVEKPVEVPAPKTTGRVEGEVLDAATRSPIVDAIVTFDQEGVLPVATNEFGRWASPELPPGPVTFSIRREGFKLLRFTSDVRVGEVTQHAAALEVDIRPGTISGVVKGTDGKPLAGVAVKSSMGAVLATTDENGAYSLQLVPGAHRLVFEAEGRLLRGAALEVQDGGVATLDFELAPQPRASSVKAGEGVLVLTPPLGFLAGRATLGKKELERLDEVADLLLRNPSKLRIEAHALRKGAEGRLVELTTQRAQAVRDHLVSRGVPAESVEAVGLGSSQPLAPHASRKGRQLNERLDLVLVP